MRTADLAQGTVYHGIITDRDIVVRCIAEASAGARSINVVCGHAAFHSANAVLRVLRS